MSPFRELYDSFRDLSTSAKVVGVFSVVVFSLLVCKVVAG